MRLGTGKLSWAVKNGIKEAYRDITGKVTTEDIEAEQICNEPQYPR